MLALTILVLAGGTYLYTQFSAPSFEIRPPTNRVEVIQQRFISGFMLKANQDRILMWETGIAAIKDHFWLGIGYNNDAEVMPKYRDLIKERTGHRFNNNAATGVHNIYLQTWINYGLLGFLAYLSILFIFLGQSISTLFQTTRFSYENSILWGSIAGVCGFMVAGFFENNFRDGEVQAMLLILMGLSLRQRQKLNDRIF
jgi:O-antigen ligase